MKFYKLSHDLETGKKYPQVECLRSFAASQINPWNNLPCNPDLRFKLRRGAVISDFLSTTAGPGCDMLISPELYESIRHFNVMPHQIFSVTVETNKDVREYLWVHLYGPSFVDSIDYDKSSFVRTEWTIPQEPISLESFSQYQQLKLKDKTGAFGVTFDSLALRDKNTILDLFFPFPFDSTIFISERLTDELIRSNYTGLSIEPTNIITCTLNNEIDR